jgi:hypothetical protein
VTAGAPRKLLGVTRLDVLAANLATTTFVTVCNLVDGGGDEAGGGRVGRLQGWLSGNGTALVEYCRTCANMACSVFLQISLLFAALFASYLPAVN